MTSPQGEPSFLALIEAVLSLAASPPPLSFKRTSKPIKAGGYSDDIFTDLSEEEKEEFECSICFQILKEAMSCVNKHNYCQSCIYVWSTSGQYVNRTKCPVCRGPGYYTRNTELDEKIGRKTVKCTMKGCKWTGLLKYLNSHRHTNYENNTNVTSLSKDSGDVSLPLLRQRNRSRPQNVTRTGLPTPPRHHALRASMPSESRGLNSLLSDDNNNSLSGRETIFRRDSADEVQHTPRPPATPRPSHPNVRRTVPTLPTLRRIMLNRNNNNNNNDSTPSSPEEDNLPSMDELQIESPPPAPVRSGMTQIRERLRDSRSRLDALVNTFGSDLAERQQEVLDVNAERERQRQEQLNEVRELGRRLGQVASELRLLLNQRSSFLSNNSP